MKTLHDLVNNTPAVLTILIFFSTIVAFVSSRVRSDIVALCCMAALLAFGIVSPKDALAGFSNSSVVIMLALFIVGGAVFQTGLAKTVSRKLLRMAGTSETKLFFLIMGVTSFVAAFVSNTGTVALLLPIILAMAKSAKISPSKLMMPLAFASSMGGMFTLIGTPPNLIVDGYLRDHGRGGFGFFDFAPIGLVCFVAGLLLLYPLSKFFMGKKSKLKENDEDGHALVELLNEYELDSFIFKLQIGDNSQMVGKTPQELDLHRRFGVTLLEEQRRNKLLGTVVQETVSANTVFSSGDVLYALGTREHINELVQIFNLTLFAEETREDHAKLDFYDLGLSEILISPESKLINLTIEEAGFRTRNNVNVLSIKRAGRCISSDVQQQTIHSGDMMLVHGAWSDIKKMKTNLREWIIIGNPDEELENVALDHKAPLAAGIMSAMVMMMVFSDQIGIPPVTTVIVAGLLMVLLGCVRSVDTAYKMIGWESIVLIAAMMSMSTALSSTGISDFIATNVVQGLQAYGPWTVLVGVYIVTSVLSTFISNSATAILVAPIAWSAATQLGVSPTPFMMTAAIAASAVFALPISTPPNAMVMNAGHYTFMDYVKLGVPLQIVMGIIAILIIPFFFPF
ncbi:SLC13 family permease [Alloprevotella sp. OH1205_COT-284]|uniref:SLC13 family permease n=1 Tax=Alloprevotella sp. OH1205_COT-284 TaxID=2491043 RepID=UPI000F5F6613|nr:SLC13 family permease [Alloprevotella sp. OH1205_COT-284]RRD80729.1 SLC13 family permease [Alloprevotella sp. OH1205_COT-284]